MDRSLIVSAISAIISIVAILMVMFKKTHSVNGITISSNKDNNIQLANAKSVISFGDGHITVSTPENHDGCVNQIPWDNCA